MPMTEIVRLVIVFELSYPNKMKGSEDGIYLLQNFFFFFFFCLFWVFIAACGLSLVAVSRGYSSLLCMGVSLWWLLLLRSTGSRCAGFGSCGTRAQ